MTANQKRHLYRSRNERIIAGICGGLADYFGLKVFNVRLALLLLILFAGLSLWVYIILWLIVPLEPNRQTL
ncbi:stress-responsive transcriptional regulator [Alistipes sp. An116]|uniref:PspC domain-containing protein n=1 Tax=Alistipes TaxID=239759 RepID=UPI000B37E21C|nr:MULTISPECIES: PspC domain-containing protein [Alistipes]OUN79221.1 stress-responsive transcriptional regulator [Alistipes sp. An54]OUQ54408.1 stress-responsive transcriptional regulator [Alistipes sp. An116]